MTFFGNLVRIITDRGKGFTSKEIENFCESEGIKHVLNAIVNPSSNGQVERLNATILNALIAAVEDDYDSWEQEIPEVQRGINMTVNATTGKAPSELLYGFRPRLKHDIVLPSTSTVNDRLDKIKTQRAKALGNINKNAKAMKLRFDKNRLQAHHFDVGDMVMVEKTPLIKGLTSGKLVQKYIGPVQVTEVLHNDRYRVQSLTKDRRRFRGVVASDRMKRVKLQKAE